jgi:DNA-binding PadR family transcriptional regulator
VAETGVIVRLPIKSLWELITPKGTYVRNLNPLSYAVLALIGRNGASAPELVQMARSGQRFHYSGAASRIYAEPKRLARLGYVEARKEPGKTRERTFYTLTERGLAALREWLASPSSFPRIQSEAAARVLASDLAEDPRAVAESVKAMRADIEDQRRLLEQAESRAWTLPHRARQLRLVRSLGRKLLDAHDEWIDEVVRELGNARPE